MSNVHVQFHFQHVMSYGLAAYYAFIFLGMRRSWFLFTDFPKMTLGLGYEASYAIEYD